MTTPPRADTRTLVALAALTFVLFRPWAGAGDPLFGSDLALFFYPLLSAIRDSLAAGHFPWWTERIFAGMPLAADPQASVFYPPAWLLFTGPFERLMAPYLAAHLLLLGAGASVAFARLGASRLGAFIGGASLMLGTTLPARLVAGHLTYLQAAAWIPWAWASLLGHMATGERRRLAVTAALLSLSLLGGFPQVTFYGILWLLWTAVSAPRAGGVTLARALAGTLAAVVLAFGLAAAMLVPGWEMSRLSVRIAGMSESFRLSDSLPLRHLATFIVPGLFGTGPASYAGGPPYAWWEFTAFNGLLPWLALPVLGLSLARHRAFFHLAIPVPVTLLLALGANTPVYPAIARLPGFSLFRLPSQITFLTAFALAGVAALAATLLDSGARATPRRAWPPLAIGAALALAAAALPALSPSLSWLPAEQARASLLVSGAICASLAAAVRLLSTGRRAAGAALLVAVVGADLLVPASGCVSYRPLTRFFPTREIVAAAAPLEEPYRILVLQSGNPGRPVIQANETLRVGGEAITGYDPLLPAGVARMHHAARGTPWPSAGILFPPPPVPMPPVTDLLNCRVVVTDDDARLGGGDFRPLPWRAADPGWRFHLNGAALGRATVYPAVTRVPDPELDARIRTIDPLSELLVDARLRIPDVGTTRPVRGARFLPRGPAAATVLDGEGAGGYLLVSQTWHPGWTARWSGGELPVLPADIGLTLVPMPAGCRLVELEFRPASVRAGLAISAASLLILGLAWLPRRRRP